MIEALGQRGSIIVYTAFEQTRIKALIDEFPGLVVHYRRFLTIVLWTSSALSPTTFTTRISEVVFRLRKCFRRWFRACRMRGLMWRMETLPSCGLLAWREVKYQARPLGLHASSFLTTARWTRSRWFGCTKLFVSYGSHSMNSVLHGPSQCVPAGRSSAPATPTAFAILCHAQREYDPYKSEDPPGTLNQEDSYTKGSIKIVVLDPANSLDSALQGLRGDSASSSRLKPQRAAG